MWSIEAPAGVRLAVVGLSLALSPNGEELAFVGIDADGLSHLYLRRLDSDAARRVEGTESALTPFWSPDGREVAFFADAGLMRVATAGGAPRLLTDRTGWDGSWSPNGTILFGARWNGALGRIDAEGGPVEIVSSTDLGPGIQVVAPQFLADGEHYIVKVEDLEGDRSGIYLGDLESSELTLLLPGLTNAAYAEGQLLFLQDENLMAQPFDPNAGCLSGEPRRIAGPVLKMTFPYIGYFSVSARGSRLVHLAGVQDAGLSEMVWVDREGNELERTGITGDLYNPRLTQDGRRLAIDVSTRTTHGDIWVFDLARGSSRRLTRHEVDESRPVWLPGEEKLAFFRLLDLYVVDASGGDEPELLFQSKIVKWVDDMTLDGRWGLVGQRPDGVPTLSLLDLESREEMKLWQEGAWDGRISPDGRWAAYASAESGSTEIYVERFPEHGERFQVSNGAAGWPLLRSRFQEEAGAFSPDGRMVAYVSDGSGRQEVYLQTFPALDQRQQVSTQGGTEPVWSASGEELFFRTGRKIMVVSVEGKGSLGVSPPALLFEGSSILNSGFNLPSYDVSADGERFIIVCHWWTHHSKSSTYKLALFIPPHETKRPNRN